MGKYDRHTSVSSLLSELQWQTLLTRRCHIRLAMLYRIRNDQVDIDCSQYLSPMMTITRGHGGRFQVPFCKSQVLAASFFPRTARDWNGLREDPSDFQSLEAFKVALMEGAI